MRRITAGVGLAVALVAGACGGGGTTRTVLVDFTSDEFASSAFLNVPAQLTVRPGTTIVFKQTWTGEPHTVTGGTIVDEQLTKGRGWLRFFNAFDALPEAGADLPDPENPGEATWPDVVRAIRGAKQKPRDEFVASYKALVASGAALPSLDDPIPALRFADVVTQIEKLSEDAFAGLRFAFNEDDDNIAQNVGQPCYMRDGEPPEDANKACSDAQQRQPVFDGRQSFYNSGIIPYEGNKGNTFEVKLADDIEPGTYLFYCAVHGPQQTSEIEVVSSDARIPSGGQVARETRAEVNKVNEPLAKILKQARDTNRIEVEGDAVEGPFAGLVSPDLDHALINEFVPKKVRVKAGEPVTWKLFGSDHTISFGVPRYFPIIEFRPQGIRINPRLGEPQGGAAPIPEQDGEGVLKIDGGSYDGDGFWSSGLVGASPYAEYTVRIAKPGTYDYACLIHPPMVGQITVT